MFFLICFLYNMSNCSSVGRLTTLSMIISQVFWKSSQVSPRNSVARIISKSWIRQLLHSSSNVQSSWKIPDVHSTCASGNAENFSSWMRPSFQQFPDWSSILYKPPAVFDFKLSKSTHSSVHSSSSSWMSFASSVAVIHSKALLVWPEPLATSLQKSCFHSSKLWL